MKIFLIKVQHFQKQMKYGKTKNGMRIWGNMHTFNTVNECSLFLI